MRLSSSSCSSSFWLRGRKFDTFAPLGRMVAARPPPLTVAIPQDNIAAVRKRAVGATAPCRVRNGHDRETRWNRFKEWFMDWPAGILALAFSIATPAAACAVGSELWAG